MVYYFEMPFIHCDLCTSFRLLHLSDGLRGSAGCSPLLAYAHSCLWMVSGYCFLHGKSVLGLDIMGQNMDVFF